MVEREARRVKERTLQARHRTNITGHPAVDAAVERVADDRMPDRAEMHANLVGPSRVNRDLAQRQARHVKRARDSRDGLAGAPRSRGHLLAMDRIAADRSVDAP